MPHKRTGNITLSNERDETVEIPMELYKGYHVTSGQVHRVTAMTDMDFIEASTPELVTRSVFRMTITGQRRRKAYGKKITVDGILVRNKGGSL